MKRCEWCSGTFHKHPRESARQWADRRFSSRARINGALLGDQTTTDAYARVLRADPCSFCGRPATDIDHIDAISRGGAHAWENLTAACRACNMSKYSEPLLTFLLRRSAQPPQTGHDDGPVRA